MDYIFENLFQIFWKFESKFLKYWIKVSNFQHANQIQFMTQVVQWYSRHRLAWMGYNNMLYGNMLCGYMLNAFLVVILKTHALKLAKIYLYVYIKIQLNSRRELKLKNKFFFQNTKYLIYIEIKPWVSVSRPRAEGSKLFTINTDWKKAHHSFNIWLYF